MDGDEKTGNKGERFLATEVGDVTKFGGAVAPEWIYDGDRTERITIEGYPAARLLGLTRRN